MKNRKIVHFQEQRDNIECKCGAKIPLLPDVKAMGEAIEVHIALHLKGVRGQSCTTLEADRLRDTLIVQVLRIAGDPKAKKLMTEFELKDKLNEREKKKPKAP